MTDNIAGLEIAWLEFDGLEIDWLEFDGLEFEGLENALCANWFYMINWWLNPFYCPVRQFPVRQIPVLQCPPLRSRPSCHVHPCDVVCQFLVLQFLVLQFPVLQIQPSRRIIAASFVFSAKSRNAAGISGLQNPQSKVSTLGKPVRDCRCDCRQCIGQAVFDPNHSAVTQRL